MREFLEKGEIGIAPSIVGHLGGRCKGFSKIDTKPFMLLGTLLFVGIFTRKLIFIEKCLLLGGKTRFILLVAIFLFLKGRKVKKHVDRGERVIQFTLRMFCDEMNLVLRLRITRSLFLYIKPKNTERTYPRRFFYFFSFHTHGD